MNRALAGAVFVFLLARTAGPQAAAPHLSKTEQADRIALLPEDDRRWLEFVEPILLDSERNFFLLLTEPHQREIFREEFWKRREKPNLPSPLGVGYRHRYEELLRAANEEYDGWRQDAGRMVLAHGEPASLEVVEGCDRVFRHLEIWTYSSPNPGYGSVRRYFFYQTAPLAPRKLWTIGDPESDVFSPGSCRKRFEDLYLDCVNVRTDPCQPGNGPCACHVYEVFKEIQSRQGSRIGGEVERGQVLVAPPVATEDLTELAARFPGIADPRAKRIVVESEKTRPSAAAAPPEPTPSRTLTYEEIRERITELPPKYRQWLDLAAPLMTTGDLVHFLLLTNAERDRFIREFFRRRRGPGV
ncbi:MAG TPA: GWxTD domain-containing protein [Thermoanaerobaculia bacterium]|nr:GWxTD domain-containing protein [Thermoanaerobaculia bacterium]